MEHLPVRLSELIGKDPPTPEVVNRIFDVFIYALNNKISKIHRVRKLFYPGAVRDFVKFGYTPEQMGQRLWGLQMTDRIYISSNLGKKMAVKTLIHELAHFLFQLSDQTKAERAVLKIERRLWKKFSETQKELLWSYVPKEITLDNVDDEPK